MSLEFLTQQTQKRTWESESFQPPPVDWRRNDAAPCCLWNSVISKNLSPGTATNCTTTKNQQGASLYIYFLAYFSTLPRNQIHVWCYNHQNNHVMTTWERLTRYGSHGDNVKTKSASIYSQLCGSESHLCVLEKQGFWSQFFIHLFF